MTTPGACLDVAGALLTFGGIRAVDNLTFQVASGETLGIIGPNGAGKTSLLNAVSGVYRIEAGTIHLDSVRIDTLRPHQIARHMVGRTFQSTGQFSDFRVVDFLKLGRVRLSRNSVIASALGLPGVRRSERSETEQALRTLDHFGFSDSAYEYMRELPYGVQKIIDIARVLASEPRLVLLDEPTSGTTSSERILISDLLQDVTASGVTMLVIDHDVSFISQVSQRLLVMNYGQLLAEGVPTEVLARPDVIDAYLGQ